MVNVINATLTLDAGEVERVDGSAASRVVPLLNTLNMDLTDKESWFGNGTYSKEDSVRIYQQKQGKMGNIDQYGLIGFLLSWVLVLVCCFKYNSLAMLMFLAGVGGGVGNIAYGWGCLMLFTTIRYFQYRYEN